MRFPSYSSEWHSYTLGEILTFYSTNSFSREKLNYDTGSVKNIHYGDIHTKFPSIVSVSDNKDIPFINNEIDLSKYSENQYLQNGDLIIADASEDYEDIGKAIEVKNIDDEKVLAGLHTILARDNNNITVNGFKAYLFSTNSLKTKIKIIANGISVLGISKNSLSKLTVNVPSKNEQNDVVDFISLIDNKIELLEQKHQYYLDFKKFLMQQIFAQKLRFAKFDYEWVDYPLKDIGKIITGTTPSTKNKDNFSDNGYLWVTPGDISNKRIVTSTERNLSKEGLNNGRELPPNSILVTCIGATIGKICMIKKVGSCNQQLNAIIPNEQFDPDFIYYIIQYNAERLKLIAGNTATPILNKKSFGNIKFEFPKLKEQQKISRLLTSMDDAIDNIESGIKNIQYFKNGLLQQMFVVRINWRCNFKLAKSSSFNKHLLILKNKIIFIIIK